METTAMRTSMDCCESAMSPAISRRALLLGGASFAAWAYLAEIRPRRRRPRSQADRGDPARRVGWSRHRRAGRRSRLCRSARFDRADIGWAARRLDAGFLFRAASGDAGIRADVSRQASRGYPCGRDAVSRPLAFRRAGRARKRFCRPRPGAIRLAQSRAGSIAEGRSGHERARRRPDHAAGVARECADGRLGAGRLAAGR